MENRKFKAVVIGVSAGGTYALQVLLPDIPADFPVPVIVVQHLSAHSDGYFVNHLNSLCKVHVKEAEEKEKAQPGKIYFSPPNYHLLIEEDGTFSLSIDERVNFARPSIDVLFETASFAYGPGLVGIVLTGANTDGSKGLKQIKEYGGYTIVQNPKTAEVNSMPRAAIAATRVDKVLKIEDISKELIRQCMNC